MSDEIENSGTLEAAETCLGGAVVNSPRVMARLPFYQDGHEVQVGTRDRGHSMDIAFFGKPVKVPTLPVEAVVDGETVSVIGIAHTDYSGAAVAKPVSGQLYQISITVVPLDASEG